MSFEDVTTSGDEESRSDTETPIEPASRQLIEGISTHAIFKLDGGGFIASWSPSARSLYGYAGDAIADEHISVLFADKEGPNPDLEDFLDRAKAGSEKMALFNPRKALGSSFHRALDVMHRCRQDDLPKLSIPNA